MPGHRTDFQRLLLEAEDGRDANFERHLNPELGGLLDALGHSQRFVRGEGAVLFDDQGGRYLDCIAGYAVHAIGRSHPRMVAALGEALVSAPPNWVQFERPPLASLLARRLCERTGGELAHTVFSNSGSEAVECAIKLARRATGRNAVLHCAQAFHGLTLGALAANGNPNLREPFGELGPSEEIPFDDAAALEQALSTRRFAAVIIEPVQGKSCRALSPGYLAEASRLADAHGTILILDEVQTGVGRTGLFFAYEHDPGARPHIVTLSKALSGGFVPVGATLVRRDIWRRTFRSMSTALVHASTFQGGTLAMTAGLLTLEILEDERLADRAARHGARIRTAIEALAARHPGIASVRGRGLLVGVELRQGWFERLAESVPLLGDLARPVFAQSFVMEMLGAHRVLCMATERTTNILKFTPPLVVDDRECDWLLGAIAGTLDSIGRAPTAFGIAHALRNLARR